MVETLNTAGMLSFYALKTTYCKLMLIFIATNMTHTRTLGVVVHCLSFTLVLDSIVRKYYTFDCVNTNHGYYGNLYNA